MTSRDSNPESVFRDAVLTMRPDASGPPLDAIQHRATTLRRRTRMRGALAAMPIVVAISVAALAATSEGNPDVISASEPTATSSTSRHATSSTVAAVPATNTSLPAPNPTRPPRSGEPSRTSPPTSTAVAVPTVTGPSPTATPPSKPRSTVAPSPTTRPTAAPATAPTSAPPTTAPPNYPPIGEGHTRMVITLDDEGLHAPARVPAGDIEILFLDQRTNNASWVWLVADGHPVQEPEWDGSQRPVGAFEFPPGSFEVFAYDPNCGCELPSTRAIITIT